jgi:hydrogenase maturation protein HypF
MPDDAPVRAELTVTGVVQGVGFRPFVYRRATDHGLAGWVKNTGDAGVQIRLEGPPDDVEGFLDDLRERPPPLSRVDGVDVTRTAPEGLEGFEIRRSSGAEGAAGTVPPDTGICDACLGDVRDSGSRYHGYWATACVDCGPRFTVIRDLPYDRPTTSMDEFPMCEDCKAEYEDPTDRRYHAQAIACPDCGPRLSLRTPDWTEVASRGEAVRAAGRRLGEGEVLAVRGVGGTHLACDATDPAVVERLRDATGRPAKPFALMAPAPEDVAAFAAVSTTEREALTDVRRPIVLLERDDEGWLDAVSPGLHTVGVMLAYSGLHHRLFDHVDGPIVMTSANLPGRPMAITRSAIRERLGSVVDGALVHDREIVARCDDSVVRVVDGTGRFLRRSRGWVPQRLPRTDALGAVGDAHALPEVLAVGAEFDATVAVTQGDDVVPSQHLGDVDGPETRSFLEDAVDHLTSLTGVDPEVVARDAHPGFVTTEVARAYAEAGLDGPVAVQHHHAHAAGLLAEHGVDEAIVVVADGTGYGPDGTVWGGEVLVASPAEYERVAGLSPFALPGGEAAIEHPARILAGVLDDDRVDDLLVEQGAVEGPEGAAAVRRQAERGVNAPVTTSAGRYLDAVSALLGCGTRRRYQGEPAMRLEALAAEGSPLAVDVPTGTTHGRHTVDVPALLRTLEDVTGDHTRADVAATAQAALAEGLGSLAVASARERGIDAVGFSGGVAYNGAVTRDLRAVVEDAGLGFLAHDRVPPGDAGISYGQAVVATARQV